MDVWTVVGKWCRPARLKGRRISALMLAVCALSFIAAAQAETLVQRSGALQFPRPASIEPNIKFWVDVFAYYSNRDFIVVDKDDIWKVYQVLRVPGDGEPTR